MGNTNSINKMNAIELQQYIINTKKQIEKLLDEYLEITNSKLESNEKIELLKKRAYNIKKIHSYANWVNQQLKLNDNISNKINKVVKRGEIWTCDLGNNVGSEENKIRPVIIIQNDTGNEKAPTTIVVPISNRPKRLPVHIKLRESDYKLEQSEYENSKVQDKQSQITGTVLLEQIKVVSKARLGRHIATVNKETFINIMDSKIKISLQIK